MNIKELNDIQFRYVRIKLDGHYERYENVDFTNLLNYIGKHYPVNGRNPIGCAYVKIRSETDKLLNVPWSKNRKLKTSKKEVHSIRYARYHMFENRENHYYIRIPYKISYIFTAIINIVAEISKETPIPTDLKGCVGKAYGLSFYNLHIEEYMKAYHKSFRLDALSSENKKTPAILFDEFEATASVFHRIFP